MAVALERANSVPLTIHPDDTAELWIDTAAVCIKARVRRSVKAGAPIFDRDIADITGMWFPSVNIKPTDQLLYLFRVDWRFGLLRLQFRGKPLGGRRL